MLAGYCLPSLASCTLPPSPHPPITFTLGHMNTNLRVLRSMNTHVLTHLHRCAHTHTQSLRALHLINSVNKYQYSTLVYTNMDTGLQSDPQRFSTEINLGHHRKRTFFKHVAEKVKGDLHSICSRREEPACQPMSHFLSLSLRLKTTPCHPNPRFHFIPHPLKTCLKSTKGRRARAERNTSLLAK